MDVFQSRSSSCSSASLARIASTSAFEIGAPAGAAAAAVGLGDVDGAEEGGGEVDPAVAVAACLDPKMADTMLPKTLIFSSCLSLPLAPSAPAAGSLLRISLGALWRGF